MKYLILILLICLSYVGMSQNPFITKWSNGYNVTSADKNFKMKFGGRIMWDNAFFSYDDSLSTTYGDLKNGTEFRRARFFNSGKIYKNISYKINFDFAGGGVSFKDVWINIGDIPLVGNLKVGYFKEPLRFETLMSSKYLTFMERSFQDALMKDRNSGIMIHKDFKKSKAGYQIGIYRGAGSSGNDKEANSGYAFTSRVSGLLMNNEEKKQLLHIGGGFSYRNPESNKYKVSVRPESHLAHKFAEIDEDSVSSIVLLNIEAAFVYKSFSLQSEFTRGEINIINYGDIEIISSYYAMASYFLTGESKPYKSSQAGLSRVKPIKNYGQDGGYGALEIAIRYSTINLNGSNLNGGQLNDISLGLNWYLNPVTRIMLNYINADVVDKGKSNIFQTRVQIDF